MCSLWNPQFLSSTMTFRSVLIAHIVDMSQPPRMNCLKGKRAGEKTQPIFGAKTLISTLDFPFKPVQWQKDPNIS